MEKAFTSLAEAAGQYDRTLSSAKNDKKAELIGLLEKLDDYITTVSNGDKTMLLSSGFDIAGIKGASQELEPIEKLNVEIGPTGQAITRVSKVAGARMYVHQCTPDPITPDSVWTSNCLEHFRRLRRKLTTPPWFNRERGCFFIVN